MALLEDLMGSVLSSDGLSTLSKKAGVDTSTAKTVASAGLPALLQGLVDNAQKGGDTADSLKSALADHAQNSGSVLDLLKGADTQDGTKIIQHLLGGNATKVESQLQKKTGADNNQIMQILGSLAPMLMSQVGQQAGISSGASGSGLMDMIGGLLGGSSGGFDLGGLAKKVLADNDKDGTPDVLESIMGIFGK